MVSIGQVRSDKFRRDFVTRTFALVAPDWPICTKFSVVTKRSQMHPNIMKCNKTWVQGPVVCIGWVLSEKFWRDFVACTFALIAPVRPFCTEFIAVTKRSQIQPNISKCNKTWVLGPLVCIECVRREKFQRDFVAQTFALIAPVRLLLHRV